MFTSNSSLSELNILFLFVVSFVVSVVIGIGLIVTKGKNKLGLLAGIFSIKPVVDYFLCALIADFVPPFFWHERNLEPINVLVQDVLDVLYLFVVILPAAVLFIILVYFFRQLLIDKRFLARILFVGDILRWVVVLFLTISPIQGFSETLITVIPIYSLAYSIVALLIVAFEDDLSKAMVIP